MISQHGLPPLLFSPFTFFSNVEERRLGWLVSLSGYYFCGLGLLFGVYATVVRPIIDSTFPFHVIINSSVGGVAAILVVGLLWIWGISSILGGRVDLALSLKATGYALAWPAIVMSTINLVVFLCVTLGKDIAWGWVQLLLIAIMIWLLVMLCACTRGLNRFGLSKMFIVVFSPLLLWAAFGLFTKG